MRKTITFLSILTILSSLSVNLVYAKPGISMKADGSGDVAENGTGNDDRLGVDLNAQFRIGSQTPFPAETQNQDEVKKSPEPSESPRPSEPPEPSEKSNTGIGAEVSANAGLGLKKVQMTADEFRKIVEEFVAMIRKLLEK